MKVLMQHLVIVSFIGQKRLSIVAWIVDVTLYAIPSSVKTNLEIFVCPSRREWSNIGCNKLVILCSGLHYFYGMSTTLDCKDWQGVFGLYNKGSLIGLGLPTHGYQTDGDDITWFEKPTSFALQVCSWKLSSFGQYWINIC